MAGVGEVRGSISDPEDTLMEKRTGTLIIRVDNRQSVQALNEILSNHAEIIIGRLGLPRGSYSIISLILEGDTDKIGSLTGQLGRLDGIEVKSALLKSR